MTQKPKIHIAKTTLLMSVQYAIPQISAESELQGRHRLILEILDTSTTELTPMRYDNPPYVVCSLTRSGN